MNKKAFKYFPGLHLKMNKRDVETRTKVSLTEPAYNQIEQYIETLPRLDKGELGIAITLVNVAKMENGYMDNPGDNPPTINEEDISNAIRKITL